MTGDAENRYDWQPIQTARRDETAFIAFAPVSRAYGPNDGMVIAFWSGDDLPDALSGNALDKALYTHWSPLPPRPARSQ